MSLDFEKIEREIEETKREQDRLQRKIRDLESSLNRAKREEARLKADFERAETKLTQAQKDVDTIKPKYERAVSDREKAEQEHRQQNESFLATESHIESLYRKLDGIQKSK